MDFAERMRRRRGDKPKAPSQNLQWQMVYDVLNTLGGLRSNTRELVQYLADKEYMAPQASKDGNLLKLSWFHHPDSVLPMDLTARISEQVIRYELRFPESGDIVPFRTDHIEDFELRVRDFIENYNNRKRS